VILSLVICLVSKSIDKVLRFLQLNACFVDIMGKKCSMELYEQNKVSDLSRNFESYDPYHPYHPYTTQIKRGIQVVRLKHWRY